MKLTTRIQLSLMMFLNFFIWGSWFVTMGTYLSKSLQASDTQNGLAYGTQSLGAIIAPFIVGLIADRFFSAQRILGVLHLMGAALMYFLSQQENFEGFYPLILTYMIIYMPTLALVNSVSFRQLTDTEKQFATLRVWGTIGWIAAGLVIGWLGWEQKNALANTFRLAAGASLFLGLYSFSPFASPNPNARYRIPQASMPINSMVFMPKRRKNSGMRMRNRVSDTWPRVIFAAAFSTLISLRNLLAS